MLDFLGYGILAKCAFSLSSPVSRTKPEQVIYRLLRFFYKVTLVHLSGCKRFTAARSRYQLFANYRGSGPAYGILERFFFLFCMGFSRFAAHKIVTKIRNRSEMQFVFRCGFFHIRE